MNWDDFSKKKVMKVMIADDYYTNRLLVLEILNSMGHDSLEAENGKQVLELLEKHDDIDLVFMDIEMPVMNGIEAMKYIREKMAYPINRIPIIALTAHTPGSPIGDSLSEGFNQTLVKPYSIDKIAEILESYKNEG